MIDISNGQERIILPSCFRFQEFQRLHNLSHPKANNSIDIVKQRYVWPNMKSDIRRWIRECLKCQKTKISRHTTSTLGSIPNLGRFKILHIDIVGPFPSVMGKKYLLTIIDRHTSLTEAVPLREKTIENIIV